MKISDFLPERLRLAALPLPLPDKFPKGSKFFETDSGALFVNTPEGWFVSSFGAQFPHVDAPPRSIL